MSSIRNILKKEPFEEHGNQYVKITIEVLTPRKTYLKGLINGKFRGDLILLENQLHNTSLYDFEIYEAQVSCTHPNDFQKNKPFISIDKDVFPKEKLPKLLLVQLTTNKSSFGVNILEPNLYKFKPIRKLHQTDGDDVFGSFTAEITGYIFDYEKTIIEEVIGVEDDFENIRDFKEEIKISSPSMVLTGETESVKNYTRSQVFSSDYSGRIWGNWKRKTSREDGCFSTTFGCLGLVIAGIFIIALLPNLLYFLPFILVPLLFNFIRPFLEWTLKIFSILLAVFFILTVIGLFQKFSNKNYIPKPQVTETPKEKRKVEEKVLDTLNNVIKDTIYKRYRSWQDYDGNIYEGYYRYNKRSYNKAVLYKNNLNVSENSIYSYDKIIYSLKENDKNELHGLYQLFDSIQGDKNLSEAKFAEMIVTFVQDIPYAIILDKGCDSKLYNDNFIKEYLSNPNAICYGYQRFGINTPIEFLGTLKGDCDTRTLLLYTIFTHYNYDVALMSSEYYGHSILGINLPYNGTAYIYNNQRYVLWETTAINAKPGILPKQTSNINYWRISLKSK